MSSTSFRLTCPARSLSECLAPVFHYSLGMLVDSARGEQSVFYRAPSLAEKRERFAAVVAFNMRRGNVGQVRARCAAVCAEAARAGSDARSFFRRAWSQSRNASSLS